MDVQQYCLTRPLAKLDFPFGADISVYRVKNKMFALYSVMDGRAASINLKCNPEQASALRDLFPSIKPGYHMNKKHWNTISLDGSVPVAEIERLIDLSYTLAVRRLRRAEREDLERNFSAAELYR